MTYQQIYGGTKMKKFKKSILATLLFTLVLAGVTAVNAETFEVIVTKLEDGESLKVNKIAGYNAGQVIVKKMSNQGKQYVMWIEKCDTGANVSPQVGFSSPCSKTLVYQKPVYISQGYNAKLNISTALTTFDSCTLSGTWTPNSY